jgi:hypothetical protein
MTEGSAWAVMPKETCCMNSLTLKLFLTPVLVGTASLVALVFQAGTFWMLKRRS